MWYKTDVLHTAIVGQTRDICIMIQMSVAEHWNTDIPHARSSAMNRDNEGVHDVQLWSYVVGHDSNFLYSAAATLSNVEKT